MEPTLPKTSHANKINLRFSFDLRYVALALLAIIMLMLLVWKPWSQPPSANARTVTVTGATTLKAVPDNFVFNLSYQNTNADKTAAIQAATAKGTELVAKLKALGVPNKLIKTSVDGYGKVPTDYPGMARPTPLPSSDEYVYTLQLTVTTTDQASTQKVQDYLMTTEPTGSVTPLPTFSETLRTQLESKARDAASRNARAKADQSAHNLGFKVGSVKSVEDSNGFNGGIIQPMLGSASGSSATKDSAPSLSVQPGENELNYSVTVTYYIK